MYNIENKDQGNNNPQSSGLKWFFLSGLLFLGFLATFLVFAEVDHKYYNGAISKKLMPWIYGVPETQKLVIVPKIEGTTLNSVVINVKDPKTQLLYPIRLNLNSDNTITWENHNK